MKRHGYSGRLATGTLAAGGTLGILIPPSVPLVIYAILTEQNIAKLFAAAMIPGIIAMTGYIIAIAIYVRVVPGQAPEHDDDGQPARARCAAPEHFVQARVLNRRCHVRPPDPPRSTLRPAAQCGPGVGGRAAAGSCHVF